LEKGKRWGKVALDIGISHPVSPLKKETLHFFSKPTSTTKVADEKLLKKELLDKEQEFINAQSKNNWAAYPAFITADTRIYRPGSAPFITDEQRNQLFSETDKKCSYQTIDAVVASSGDLGYTYGKAIIAITKDGNTKTLNGNYLRIWKKSDGTD